MSKETYRDITMLNKEVAKFNTAVPRSGMPWSLYKE